MAITPLAPLDRTSPTFRTDVDNFFGSAIPAFVGQANALAANLNSIAAGGAYAIPFTFMPYNNIGGGLGYLTFTNGAASQSAATSVFTDLRDARLASITALLSSFVGSSSQTKGHLRIVKVGDPSKYLVFSFTAASQNGYTQTHVGACVDSSSANPFAYGDSLLVYFQRTGDKGDKGDNGFSFVSTITGTQTWSPPAWCSKIEVTVIDAGGGSGTATSGYADGGSGGNVSISVRTVTPSAAYTATVGAGGSAAAAGTVTSPTSGGASSFSGPGLTTLTTASGDLKIPGGGAMPRTNQPCFGGASFYCPTTVSGTPTGFGGGAPGPAIGGAGIPGKAGAIIIRY